MLLMSHFQSHACMVVTSSRCHSTTKAVMLGMVVSRMMTYHHGYVVVGHGDGIFLHGRRTITSIHGKKCSGRVTPIAGVRFFADLFVGARLIVRGERSDIAIVTNPLVVVTTCETLLVRWCRWCHNHTRTVSSVHQ